MNSVEMQQAESTTIYCQAGDGGIIKIALGT